jgi:hypothetical protein
LARFGAVRWFPAAPFFAIGVARQVVVTGAIAFCARRRWEHLIDGESPSREGNAAFAERKATMAAVHRFRSASLFRSLFVAFRSAKAADRWRNMDAMRVLAR